MCKTWPGSFAEKKDLEEGFNFQPTKNSICIQVLEGFSLNSWITASFRCQDTEMGQRHCVMTCGYLKESEVRALNISSLVFHQATPDVPGSHPITLFPTAAKGAGWFPHKEIDDNAFWIILGENSFPSLGRRMGSTCLKAQSKDSLGSRRCKKGGTAWSFSMLAAKALKQYCFHAQNKIPQQSPPRQHRPKIGSLFHQECS